MTETNNDKLPGGSIVYMTDVSRVETDDACGMRYWLGYMEGGQGVIRKSEVVDKLLGVAIHDDLRSLSGLMDISPLAIQNIIDEVLSHLSAEDRQDVGKMELLYRRLGWFAAFAMFMEPEIRKEYRNIPIDSALVLDKDPLWVVAYPDRLLKSRSSGSVVYREYVPMGAGLTQERWLKGWFYNVRLHVGMAAAIQETKDVTLSPTAGQVMGLGQGFRSLLNNRLVHPYVWAYHNKATDEWSSDRKTPDCVVAPVWAFPGGVVAWIKLCGAEVAKCQFQLSPAIPLNKPVIDAWVSRRLHRERQISTNKTAAATNFYIRSVYFPKVTNQCQPPNGPACPFLPACWDKKVEQLPLISDLFVPNNPALSGGISS